MTTATATARTSADVEEFVRFFAEGWARGARGGFFEHFDQCFAPDAVFEQPLAPRVHGPAGARELFEPLFAAMPDLHGEVVRWGATEDGVVIELDLRGTFGGRPIAWTTLDRIVLDDEGLIRSRKAHVDPLPLVAQMARSPLALARLLPRLVLRRGGRP